MLRSGRFTGSGTGCGFVVLFGCGKLVKVAACSGGLGDIVYAVPVMQKLGVTRLYAKVAYYYPPHGDMCSSLQRLLAQQGIECLPTSGEFPPFEYEPGLRFDYDLDQARKQPARGSNHIVTSYLNQFGLPHDDWTKPWLRVEGEHQFGNYCVVQRTPRWRRLNAVDWMTIYGELEERYDRVIFVGFPEDHRDFCRVVGKRVDHVACFDVLDFAILIRDCRAFYGNQSVGIPLAQGLGKEYWIERNAMKQNALMGTPNEHILLDPNFPDNQTIRRAWQL